MDDERWWTVVLASITRRIGAQDERIERQERELHKLRAQKTAGMTLAFFVFSSLSYAIYHFGPSVDWQPILGWVMKVWGPF